ncbi:hypothetical protein MTO96_022205 [Rhipicephalus appendiculatus]
MAAQQAQWPTQQPAGWEAQQEDPYAASYYEAYPASPGLEVYPASPAYPAVLETPVTEENQRKRADDQESGSWSLNLLRACVILILLIVSGLIVFVMVSGSKWLWSDHTTTTVATVKPTSPSRFAHRENERTKPAVQPAAVTVMEGYNLADHVSQYRRARKKAAVRDDELASVPSRFPRKLRGRAGTARRKRTEMTPE